MSGLTLITAPSGEPILLDEIKDHLRISIDDDDKGISRMITVARRWCEKMMNRAFMTQTWDLYLDDYPDVPYKLPRPPLQSVTHIKWYDTDDTATTVSTSIYRVDSYSFVGRINLKDGQAWDGSTKRTLDSIVIRFIAGYGGRSSVPEEIKQAIKLMVGHLYEHREETITERFRVTNIPLGIFNLLDIDRAITFP